jgi:hypothetical protein
MLLDDLKCIVKPWKYCNAYPFTSHWPKYWCTCFAQNWIFKRDKLLMAVQGQRIKLTTSVRLQTIHLSCRYVTRRNTRRQR